MIGQTVTFGAKMLDGAATKVSIGMGRAAIWLLKRSGLLADYWSPWRWALFDQAERAGFHILPAHFYSPIPRRPAVDDQTPKFAATGDLEPAMALLTDLHGRYSDKLTEILTRPSFLRPAEVTEFRLGLAPYSASEAAALYGLIRSRRPKRVIEVGCGHTTLLMAEAIRDEGYAPEYTCIEPYRPVYLASPPAEVTRWIDKPVQAADLAIFRALGAGDFLFIDSSHVVAYGSDTVHEILSILPVLAPGVIVHFHDIFLPYDYPSEWLTRSRFFWAEQYMLAAWLQSAPAQVILPMHQIYRQRRLEMQRLFPREAGKGPGAYWIEMDSGRLTPRAA